MIAVSGTTGLASLIGSKLIWNRASNGSVWSEKGPRIQGPTPNQMHTASVRGRPDPDGVKKGQEERTFFLVHLGA